MAKWMVVFITGVINENAYGEVDVSKNMLIQPPDRGWWRRLTENSNSSKRVEQR
jgi:hypothetical protein